MEHSNMRNVICQPPLSACSMKFTKRYCFLGVIGAVAVGGVNRVGHVERRGRSELSSRR